MAKIADWLRSETRHSLLEMRQLRTLCSTLVMMVKELAAICQVIVIKMQPTIARLMNTECNYSRSSLMKLRTCSRRSAKFRLSPRSRNRGTVAAIWRCTSVGRKERATRDQALRSSSAKPKCAVYTRTASLTTSRTKWRSFPPSTRKSD